MSDRRTFFKKQKVIRTELNEAFDFAEQGDRDAIDDLGWSDLILEGLDPSETGPTSLSIDVTAGIAFDAANDRIPVNVLQNIDVSVDETGASTAVIGGANSRYLTVVLRFDRAESQPKVDGNGNTVFTLQEASFEFAVIAGIEDVSPTVPTVGVNDVIICDIFLAFGASVINNGDIVLTRRNTISRSPIHTVIVGDRTAADTPATVVGSIELDGSELRASRTHEIRFYFFISTAIQTATVKFENIDDAETVFSMSTSSTARDQRTATLTVGDGVGEIKLTRTMYEVTLETTDITATATLRAFQFITI